MLEKVIPWKRSSYSQLADDESRGSTDDLHHSTAPADAAIQKLRNARILNFLLGSILALGLVCYSLDVWPLRRGVAGGPIVEHSPLVNDVSMAYHERLFNGSFMHENIYRREASPEVDAAWDALGINYRASRIPEEQALKSGMTPAHVHIRQKYGGGYPGNVEGLHHLHCLNLLRESLYYNVDYYRAKGEGAFKNKEGIVRLHVSHCVDILRQQLMCMPDVGVLGQIWYDKEAPKAFVDFNTNHQCRDYEAIRKWAEEHQLPEDDTVPDDFLLPPEDESMVYDAIP